MKVVIDTNVFVSSFLGGRPRQIIDLWKRGEIILCLSKEILDEYVDVLQRIGLGSEEELTELLALFKQGVNIRFTAKTPQICVVKDDPSDDKFVECAVKLKAGFVVTGDKSLKSIVEYQGIKIMSPQELLKIISGKHPAKS